MTTTPPSDRRFMPGDRLVMRPPTAAEILEDAAKTYAERNRVYGNNYVRHGDVMMALFPNGVMLKTPADHNRFALLTHCVTKVTRYANQFGQFGHKDSARDLAVYAAMLEELTP